MNPEEQQRRLMRAGLQLTKSYIAFRQLRTPGGDEYARRAMRALKYLRVGNIKQCQLWGNLVLTK